MEIGSGVGYSYSKPSRSEEAWSFASAKLLNQPTQWARRGDSDGFAGRGATCLPKLNSSNKTGLRIKGVGGRK
jgi:hypothetical protein